MSRLLPRLCDFLLFFATTSLFGACLTAKLRTGSYGLEIPEAPYLYERADFFLDAVLAGLLATAALALAQRLSRGRRSALGRAALVVAAALLAIYLGPPDPQAFGNTWARGEATFELFLAQWDIALPLALAAAAVRGVLPGAAGSPR
ncbi:hypothetical protein [Achromobacter ruhlandii]|uniref:hypothetical protein n=1 Tax=Achromobacter ruhlandii TaxID=72557 RepID=UPI0007BF7426|nr:hypothetical protein [Achromobacter ruhlandii]